MNTSSGKNVLIQGVQTIRGSINTELVLQASVCIPKEITGGSKTDQYDGPYTVVPSFSEQKLSTKNKQMNDDVLVLEIPYSEVTNTSGGLTINIGG